MTTCWALFDAGTLRFQLSQWAASTQLLERYRQQHAYSGALGEVDKMLARAYRHRGERLLAAQAYRRLAANQRESLALRRDAGWAAAKLFQSEGRIAEAISSYQHYLDHFAADLAQAQEVATRGTLLRQPGKHGCATGLSARDSCR